MLVELTKSDYEIFAEYLTLYQPHIEFELIACDDVLAELGLADEPLYTLEIKREDLSYVMEASLDYEIDLYNTPDDEIDENTENYKLYCRYGWISDYFYNNYGLD